MSLGLSVRSRCRVDENEELIWNAGWSCAAETFDFPYILALCDHVSLDSAVAKEAARSLRKELKYGAPEAQERAVRLMGIMMRNTDLRFKRGCSFSLDDPLAEPLELRRTNRVKEVPGRGLGLVHFEEDGPARASHDPPRSLSPRLRLPGASSLPLAIQSLTNSPSQRDSDLSPLTTLWNKLKPPDEPINGSPLDPEDPLFVPTADPRRAQQQRSGRSNGRMPTQDEELEKLRRDAVDAKGSAAMLSEAVSFTSPEELSSNEIVSVRPLPLPRSLLH